jgi:hypothetical protein
MTKQTQNIAGIKKFNIGNKFIEIGQEQFSKYGIVSEYYGAAHSKDNIILFLKNENILFGGCLVTRDFPDGQQILPFALNGPSSTPILHRLRRASRRLSAVAIS